MHTILSSISLLYNIIDKYLVWIKSLHQSLLYDGYNVNVYMVVISVFYLYVLFSKCTCI